MQGINIKLHIVLTTGKKKNESKEKMLGNDFNNMMFKFELVIYQSPCHYINVVAISSLINH